MGLEPRCLEALAMGLEPRAMNHSPFMIDQFMNGIQYYPRIGMLRLGEPLEGSWGNPAGRAATPGL